MLVFVCTFYFYYVVKLTPAPLDPIPGRHPKPPPPPEIIDGEEEWIVEEILDSRNSCQIYVVKRMIRGLGDETSLTYSQTLNM